MLGHCAWLNRASLCIKAETPGPAQPGEVVCASVAVAQPFCVQPLSGLAAHVAASAQLTSILISGFVIEVSLLRSMGKSVADLHPGTNADAHVFSKLLRRQQTDCCC